MEFWYPSRGGYVGWDLSLIFVPSQFFVSVPLSDGLKSFILRLKYSQSDVLRSRSDNVVNNRQHKILYTHEERKFHFSCHIWHFMFSVGLTFPQYHCVFPWTYWVLSLVFLLFDILYSGNVSSWRSYHGNIFLLAWYVSCDCEIFPVNLIVFAINDFYKQLCKK